MAAQMLEPHGRTLLFDVLKPPEGHSLDAAIATTFTLDLLALLTAPVAFSLFDVDDHRELLDKDSLTLLESLRRYADKITIFCQAGYIALPKIQFPQLEFLEKSIVQCRAGREGALFHPKIWLLRFVSPEHQVTYRFACLTRNLTFDRTWDTVLTLEGPLLDRQRAIAANNPLGDFLRDLLGRTGRPVDDTVADRIRLMEGEARRVDFQLPDGFESYEFHPLAGGAARTTPLEKRQGRMLVISPFISDGGLQNLTRGRHKNLIVSRPESLEQAGCRLDAFDKVYVLARETEQEAEGTPDQSPMDLTRGLHAKCYVIDSESKAHIFTGSANATEGAFNGNVEFMVELVGPKSKVGIDALFRGENDRPALGSLLEEFKPQPKPADEAEEGLRAALERTRHALAGLHLTAIIAPNGDDFSVRLESNVPWRHERDVRVECWPVSVGQGHSRALAHGQQSIMFERLSFEALTAFFAFRVSIGEPERSDVFVFNVPLQGAPADRRERLLRSFIKDRQRLMRFLMFLLADDSELADAFGTKVTKDAEGMATTEAAHANGALLESLLRTLHRTPERLDAVARLVEDVRSQPDAGELLPPSFDEIWTPIWTVRRGPQS
jgi:hypothetical protein